VQTLRDDAAWLPSAPQSECELVRCSRSVRPRRRFVRIFVVALSVAIAALSATVAIAQGGDPKSARSIAATCANCHGTGGVSVGDIESLAGKPREEIVRKMQEFKSGARPATIMNQLAKGYTDEQIEALAGWFAAQKPSK
jgi:sulfide dehydrogenase cytochrome subunit